VKAHHDRPAVDGDTLGDIGHLKMDHFWSRCEEQLPEGWSLHIRSMPVEGVLIYQAMAWLEDPTTPKDQRPATASDWRGMPERALEELFYRLRDGLISRPSPHQDEPPPGSGSPTSR
jgi:hypothetical protein